MGDSLVIVESPAKAKTIKKFLGKDFDIEASMGHVRDLPKSQFGVDLENEYEPKYITIRGKGKVLQKLRRKAKKADRILLATDPDREGEAISWHLAQALKLDPDEPCRIAFNEITQEAVQSSLNEIRPIDADLVNAQQARRILDRLVGYKLSPLLWRKVRRGLSAGRVQSVAVRLICDREEEIEAFEPEEYWTLSVTLKKLEQAGENDDSLAPPAFEADYYGPAGQKKQDRLPDEESVQAIIQDVQGQSFTVDKVKRRKRRRYPNPAFTTSRLQQTASRYLGFSVKKTMTIAQQLYEGLSIKGEGTTGLITYIRTDSTRLSNQAVGEAVKFIKDTFGSKFSTPRSQGKKKQEGAQDAHEAIRPTSVFRQPSELKSDLSQDQWKLYRLIWRQFVASQMPPMVLDTVTVDFELKGHRFRARGSQIKFRGYRILWPEEDDRKKENILPPLAEGEVVDWVEADPEQHFTQPPPRYNEASLVKTLEELGIGRPSTYAPIIGTIEQRGYVEHEGKRFKPTDLGKIVTDLLKENFPDIVDVEFTAELEEELDEIEEGKQRWRNIVGEFYRPFEKALEEADEKVEPVEFPEEETDVECENCGRNMVVKHGRYGKFLACPGYPDCKNTKPYLERVGVSCPECGGDMVERQTRRGRRFYGCSNYPDCEFATWNKPRKESCPKCDAFLIEKRPRGGEPHLECVREACDYRSETVAAD